MSGIFISYRRDDSAGYAGRLYDRLSAHFGTERVFMDVEGIEIGSDFIEAIEQAVGTCEVLIVLIGNEWLTISNSSGLRRLEEPHDFIRLEISTALRRDKRVVPVLVEGASMPVAEDLPAEIGSLARRQAIEVSHKQWEGSTGELIQALERIFAKDVSQEPTIAGGHHEADNEKRSPAKAVATSAATMGDSAQVSRIASPRSRKKLAMGVVVGCLILAVAGLVWQAQRASQLPPIVRLQTKPRDDMPASSQANKPALHPQTDVAVEAPILRKPFLSANETRIDFGTHILGSSHSVNWRIVNEGDADAPLQPAQIAGAQAANFRVMVDTCGTSLAKGRSCEVSVLFKPLGKGPKEAKLILTLADHSQSLTLALQGIGAAATTSAAPVKNATAPAKPAVAIRAVPTETGRQQAQSGSDAATARADRPSSSTYPARSADTERAADNRYPQNGERWIYRSRGMWPTSPKRRFQITVSAADERGVTEIFQQLEPDGQVSREQKASRGATGQFVEWREIGSEFSPWLGAYLRAWNDVDWGGIATSETDGQWGGWYTRAQYIGHERVSVPLGSFDAWKVEVWSTRHPTGGRTQADIEPVRVHYLIWYSPQTKRYLKMTRTVTSASKLKIEDDIFELVEQFAR